MALLFQFRFCQSYVLNICHTCFELSLAKGDYVVLLSYCRSRKKDKLRYRYPRGESYLDVIQRFAVHSAIYDWD